MPSLSNIFFHKNKKLLKFILKLLIDIFIYNNI